METMLAKDFLPTSGPTKADLQAGLTVLLAVSETIREAKELPEGPLYAAVAVMGKVDLAGFEKILGVLVGARLIERKNYVVRWIGPTFEEEARRTTIVTDDAGKPVYIRGRKVPHA